MFHPGTSNEALSCPKCSAVAFRTIETRRNKYKAIRRRRKCTECDYRLTTYEVTQSFYEETIFFRKIAEQILNKFGAGSTGAPGCDTCQFNMGHKCNFEFPEYGTDEAEDCTFYKAET
jgi:hypothetical protein